MVDYATWKRGGKGAWDGLKKLRGMMGLLMGFDFRFRGPIQIVLFGMVILSMVWRITLGWDRP